MPILDPEARREYQNNWMKQRRNSWIEENGPCVDCSSTEDLTVDHKDPKEKVTHRVWSWSKERRAIELAKCVVRCWPCHLIKSSGEKAKGVDHGRSILTEAQVLEIRRRIVSESGASLGREYGVHKQVIYYIRDRKRWKHI